MVKNLSVHSPPFMLGGFSGKQGGDFFRGLQFLQKKKLKPEIFNDKKKFMNKNVFLCHN